MGVETEGGNQQESVPISIVIPVFNAERWIGFQLESLALQEDAPPFEIVVADNGCTDRTIERISVEKWPFDLRIVDASESRGAAFARNVGAAAARGEYLMFCDADDYVSARWVRGLWDALRASKACLVAGAVHHERFNESDVLNAYGIGPDPAQEELAEAPVFEEREGYGGYLPGAPGGSFAVRRSDYLAVGGMDGSYPGGAEDIDFAWRLQEATGGRVVTAPRAFIHYRLKNHPRDVFRQQQSQQLGRTLLWWRNKDTTMQGPSLKSSVLAIVRDSAALLYRRHDRGSQLARAQRLGVHVGALNGILRFKVLRAAPQQRLWPVERTLNP